MGQQQLLLIVLGIIIVALAVFVGINMFTSSAIESKRNNLINECVNLAALAQQHYRRPAALGGGGRTFTNWAVPSELAQTANGRYEADVQEQVITIKAVGNEVVTGNDSVEVKFFIYPNDYNTQIVH